MRRALILAAVLAAGAAGAFDASPLLQFITAQSWTPASLGSKLAIWYDASDSATVLDAGGNVATNAAPVQTWSDKSGNARHATAPAEAQRPTYQTAVQNGRAVLRTDGASQLDIASAGGVFRNKTAGYIFVVAKDADQAGGDAAHNLVLFASGTGAARLNIASLAGSPGTWACRLRRLDADALVAASAGPAAGHNIISGHGDWAGGVGRVWTNGVEVATVELPAGAGATSDTDGLAAYLFRNNSSSEMPADSEIAEVVVINAAMTDAEVTSLNAYLKAKWGTP
jgi:hypothetical protein